MAAIDGKTEVLEEFEALLEARSAKSCGNERAYEGVMGEIENELTAEYAANIRRKVERWLDVTPVQWFYNRRSVQFYFQAKMLYRDGFYEAAIMLSRSIAEMVCYDRLDGATHPFGTLSQTEKESFRRLINWLHANDPVIDATVHKNLNTVYDIGNNYVHPKSGQSPTSDSRDALMLVGEALFIVYGVKDSSSLVGRRIKSAYTDFPDINSGQNFQLTGFLTPQAALAHARRHKNAEPGAAADRPRE